MRSDSQQFNRRGISGTAGSNYDSKVRDVIDDYFDNPAAFFKNATELLATPGLNAVHFANVKSGDMLQLTCVNMRAAQYLARIS